MSYPKQQFYPQVASASAIIRSDLLQAIDQNNVRVCEELLTNDPAIVHEIGWNDLTPLHQVCLRGQLESVKLMLRYGAKLEARSTFGETPLHYACRRGNVRVIHVLIQAGCDVTAVDKQDRSCIHFVAIGGNVAAMHYLGTQTDLQYDAKDGLGDTALHIACTHRHFMLVKYLLRNRRSDPKCQNNKGVSVLHIAARMGNIEIIWQLLMVGGLGLFHLKDEGGRSPIDAARLEATPSRQAVVKALQHYSKQPSTAPPSGPSARWWCLLLLPFIWASLVFVLSSYLNSHSGHFAVSMFIVLFFFLRRQEHRIKHLARWPNPIFVGSFAAGVFHCIIAASLKFVIELQPSFAMMSLMVILCSSCVYYLRHLVFGDPGVVRQARTLNGHPMTIVDVATGRCRESDFCAYTEIIRPDRSKYCKLCERLVVDLDHHCLFVMNCIARGNHRDFVILLFNVMVLQMFFIFEAFIYVNTFYPNSVIDSSLSLMFHYQPWLFDLVILCFCSLIWESTLVFVQLKNIALGQTAYFMSHRRHRITVREGIINLLKFFIISRVKKLSYEGNPPRVY